MFDSSDPLRLEYVSPDKGGTWMLHEDLTYFDEAWGEDGAFITVPEGFVTDLASIPRGLWNLLPKAGPYVKAAVVHDWLYWDGRIEGAPITRGDADGVFKRAMESVGVGAFKRNLIWLAVRVGGGGMWDAYRRGQKKGNQAAQKAL